MLRPVKGYARCARRRSAAPESATDPLGNTVTVTNDYRVLAPVLVTDPNGNRQAVALDALGMVIKTAVMGKLANSDGDTLADPTTELEYNLFAWKDSGKPTVVHTTARETHGVGAAIANARHLSSPGAQVSWLGLSRGPPPHRSGLADFPHPAPHVRDSLCSWGARLVEVAVSTGPGSPCRR